MIETLYHVIGFCGEFTHPSLLMGAVLILGAGVGVAFTQLKGKLTNRN